MATEVKDIVKVGDWITWGLQVATQKVVGITDDVFELDTENKRYLKVVRFPTKSGPGLTSRHSLDLKIVEYAPRTVEQLREDGVLDLGLYFKCVRAPRAGIANFTVGNVYEVALNPDGIMGLKSDFGVDSATLSTFIPADPITTNEPVVDQATPADDPDDKHVFRPTHYAKWAIEPITFIMKNNLSFEIGNIVKYAVRAGSKLYDGMDATQSEITDLEKVRRYAEMRINQLKDQDVL